MNPPALALSWWGIGGGRTGVDSGGRPAGSGTIGDGSGEYCAMGGMVESERLEKGLALKSRQSPMSMSAPDNDLRPHFSNPDDFLPTRCIVSSSHFLRLTVTSLYLTTPAKCARVRNIPHRSIRFAPNADNCNLVTDPPTCYGLPTSR